MANHALKLDVSYSEMTSVKVRQREGVGLDRVSAAFGLSAAVAIVFNTVLAWIKDAYAPLNTFMAHLMGHHWITHGVFDVAVFLLLGAVFLNTGIAERMEPRRVVTTLVAAVIAGGLGLAAWFVFF